MLRIHVDPWFLRAGSNSPSAKRPMKNQVPGTIPVWAQVIWRMQWFKLIFHKDRLHTCFQHQPTWIWGPCPHLGVNYGELHHRNSGTIPSLRPCFIQPFSGTPRWKPQVLFGQKHSPMILAGHTLSFWTRPHAGSAGQMSTQKLKTHVPGQGCNASGILSITGPFNNKHWDLAMRIATKHEREVFFSQPTFGNLARKLTSKKGNLTNDRNGNVSICKQPTWTWNHQQWDKNPKRGTQPACQTCPTKNTSA